MENSTVKRGRKPLTEEERLKRKLKAAEDKIERLRNANADWHHKYGTLENKYENLLNKPTPENEMKALNNQIEKLLIENMTMKRKLRKYTKK